MKKTIYLDNNATTKVDTMAIEAMLPMLANSLVIPLLFIVLAIRSALKSKWQESRLLILLVHFMIVKLFLLPAQPSQQQPLFILL